MHCWQVSTTSKFTLTRKSGVTGTHTAPLAGVLQFVSRSDKMSIAIDAEDPVRDAEGPRMIFLEPTRRSCCPAGHLPLPLRVTF